VTAAVLVDGEPGTSIGVFDSAVVRGDGCFEAIRSYSGEPYALAWHLDRLERSAGQLDMSLPERSRLVAWVRQVAAVGDGVVRLIVTRGDAIGPGSPEPRTIVMHHPLPPRTTSVRLAVMAAPWHPAGRWSELAGAKTLSYAPNLAAGREAKSRGFDDALLVSDHGIVLEGPTFSIGWIRRGRLVTPTLDLYVLDSITRRTVLQLAERAGLRIEEVISPIDEIVDSAEEVFAMSTVKEIVPVLALDSVAFEPGPVTARLASMFSAAVAGSFGT
jgi:branched-chain amino acid aminotransferase